MLKYLIIAGIILSLFLIKILSNIIGKSLFKIRLQKEIENELKVKHPSEIIETIDKQINVFEEKIKIAKSKAATVGATSIFYSFESLYTELAKLKNKKELIEKKFK